MYTYKSRVIRVVDGDTLIVDIDLGFNVVLSKQTLRLARINAPELNTDKGTALKHNLELMLESKELIVTTRKDKKEKFGRWLAEVELEGYGNLNDWLLVNKYVEKY